VWGTAFVLAVMLVDNAQVVRRCAGGGGATAPPYSACPGLRWLVWSALFDQTVREGAQGILGELACAGSNTRTVMQPTDSCVAVLTECAADLPRAHP
jgi:hypothetical protein